MHRMKGLLLGMAGGAVGAALVLIVLVVVFDFGRGEQATVARPAVVPADIPVAGSAGLSPSQLYSRVSDGVVMVRATFAAQDGWNPWGDPQQSAQSLGTGFAASKAGDIITNAHVVLDQQGQTADSVTVVFNTPGGEGDEFKAQLVGVDGDSDVAVLRVDPDKAPVQPLTLGDSSKVVVGEPVVAIGNPLGYDFSITSGIVSAVERSIEAPTGAVIPNAIQTDAAINPGNSGGPLINGRGEVIGVNEQIATQSGGNEGLGFAVPINTAIRVMEQLKQSGQVTYAWLGIGGKSLTPDLAKTFDLSVERGVLVETVAADGPAEKAGIRGGGDTVTIQGQQYVVGGDVIVKVDDTAIESFDDLTAFLLEKKPGDRIEVQLVRDGKTRTVEVTLGERPKSM
jgi:S1-C subfamily serine protease